MAQAAATETKIQTALWQMELGRGKHIIRWLAVAVAALALGLVWYPASQFRGLEKREAMDMAQLARNIARGQGYTTHVIRPLSLWQQKNHSRAADPQLLRHPDTYNPPLYPLLLAALFKLLPEQFFQYQLADRIHPPERWVILPLNGLCLLLGILVVYLWAKQLFDRRVAITAGLLLLLSDTLWSYAVSGLPTTVLLLLLALALLCLFRADQRLSAANTAAPERAPAPAAVPILLVLASAVLLGLCFLTRYLAGLFVVPAAVYVARIFRGRAAALWAALYVAVFAAVITPWLVRNHRVSGSTLGIAKYELVNQTGPYAGDVAARSYEPDFSNAYSLRALAGKFLTGARKHLLETALLPGSGFVALFFGAGLMYGFRRRELGRLRGAVLGLLAAAIVAMSLIGSPAEPHRPEIHGGNLIVLLLPWMTVFGVVFFFLLLDRIPFRIRLTRGAAIGAFVLLNISPILFTLLPPRRPPFPYPPYYPPAIRHLLQDFGPEEIGVSDMPWAVAWYGGHRTLWLPLQLNEGFYHLHDWVAPRPRGFAFMLLTPYMLDRSFLKELVEGEYREWFALRMGQLPPAFPLKAARVEAGYLLLADRPRWAPEPAEPGAAAAPAAPQRPQPSP